MATEVYLIRHGQTMGNVTGERLYNPGLTALGRWQAERLAEALRPAGLTLVMASPLRRALETAVPLAEATGAPLRVCNDLAEVNAWEPYRGSSRRDLGRRFPRAELEPEMPDRGWSYRGPEGPEEFRRRVQRTIDLVAALPPGCRVALVAHGTFNALLLAAWLGAREDGSVTFNQDNAGINRVALHPAGVTLRCCNDTAHLDPR